MKRFTVWSCSVLIISSVLISAQGVSARLPRLTGRASMHPLSARELHASVQGIMAPRITSVQIFLDGEPVTQMIVGTKAKRYSLEVTGVGFDPGAKVVVDGMKARVTSQVSGELDARLKGGPLMFPGEVAVRVLNPDGGGSNSILIEIVTDPSILSIAMITPDFGPSGTQITITGSGFSAKGNHIRLLSPGTDRVGVTSEVDSSDGRTLVFSLPDIACPPCSLSLPPCEAPCFQLSPGDYDLFVINDKGMSNGLRMLVSSPGGPIGVWGVQNLSVEVTDTQVMISGPCFAGEIPQTLMVDAMGNFKLAGTFTPMIGPIGQARPATYQGTVIGNTMTLSIVSESSTLGPFTLAFGVEVRVVHPCA